MAKPRKSKKTKTAKRLAEILGEEPITPAEMFLEEVRLKATKLEDNEATLEAVNEMLDLMLKADDSQRIARYNAINILSSSRIDRLLSSKDKPIELGGGRMWTSD